jgi:hypothetical protein
MSPIKATVALAKRRASEQSQVNSLFTTEGREAAEAEARNLSQAEGPEWVLAQVSLVLDNRAGGVYAIPGDIVLMRQDMAGVPSFYSLRSARSCIAGAGIKPLDGWDEAFRHWRHLEYFSSEGAPVEPEDDI